MPIGQIRPGPHRPGQPLGSRSPGPQARSRAVPASTAPRPRTPLARGMNRAHPGTNNTLGRTRTDRPGTNIGASPTPTPINTSPRTRSLRPLHAERLHPLPPPLTPTVNPSAPSLNPNLNALPTVAPANPYFNPQTFPATSAAYSPLQPQPLGPFAPTPGTTGQF